MAEEFIITATFDSTQLQAGFERATAIVKTGSEQMASAMKTAEVASAEFQQGISSAASTAGEKLAVLQARQEALLPVISQLTTAEQRLANARSETAVATAAYEEAQKDLGADQQYLIALSREVSNAQAREAAVQAELNTLRQQAMPVVSSFTTAASEAAAANQVLATEEKLAQKRVETTLATAELEQAQKQLGTDYAALNTLSKEVVATQTQEAAVQAELNQLREQSASKINLEAAALEAKKLASATQMQLPGIAPGAETEMLLNDEQAMRVAATLNALETTVTGTAAKTSSQLNPALAKLANELYSVGFSTNQALGSLERMQAGTSGARDKVTELSLALKASGVSAAEATTFLQGLSAQGMSLQTIAAQHTAAATQGELFTQAELQAAAASKEAAVAATQEAIADEYLARAKKMVEEAKTNVLLRQEYRLKYPPEQIQTIEQLAAALKKEDDILRGNIETTQKSTAARQMSAAANQAAGSSEEYLAQAVKLKAEIQAQAANTLTETDRKLLAMSDLQLARQMQLADARDKQTAAIEKETAVKNASVVATEKDAAAHQIRAISVANGVTVTKAVTDTINLANTAMNSGRPALYSEALAVLQKQLEGTKFKLLETAEGIMIVKAASDKAAASKNSFGGMVSYVTGRLLSEQMGLGATSFAVGMLARSMSMLQPIMMALFIPTMVITFAEAIGRIIDKVKEFQNEIRKAQVELSNITAETIKHTSAIEIENMKLEDQILKLEGRPTTNKLAIALAEANQKAQELTVSINQALEKTLETLEKAPTKGFWFHTQQIFTVAPDERQAGTGDFVKKVKPSFESAIEANSQYVLALASATEAEIAHKQAIELKDKALIESTRKTKEDAEARVEVTRKNLLGEKGAMQDALKTMRDAGWDIEQLKKKRFEEWKRIQEGPITLSGPKPTKEAYVDHYMEALETQWRTASEALQNLEVAYQAAQRRRELMLEKAGLTPDEGADSIDRFKEVLNQARLSLDAHHVITTKSEIDYWENILTHERLTVKQRQSIEQELATLMRRLAQETSTEIMRLDEVRNTYAMSRIDQLRAKLESLQVTKQRLETEYAPGKAVGPPGIEATKGAQLVQSGVLKTQLGVTPEAANIDRVTKEIVATQRAINEEIARNYLRDEDVKFEAARRGSIERVRIAQDELAFLARIGLATSEMYDSTEKRIIQAKRDWEAEKLKIDEQYNAHRETIELTRVDQAQRNFEVLLLNSEKNSSQTIAQEIAFADQIYQIHRRRLEDDLRLAELNPNTSPAVLGKLQDQIYELTAKHEAEKLNIRRKALNDHMELERQFSDSMERSIQNLLVSTLKTYKDFFQAIQNLYLSLANVVAGFIAKKIQAEIDAHILEPIWEKIFGKPKEKETLDTAAKSLHTAGEMWQRLAEQMGVVLDRVASAPPPIIFPPEAMPSIPSPVPVAPTLAEVSSGPIEEQARAQAGAVSAHTGIPANLIYGQWGHETGGWTSRVAKELNNLAGIKEPATGEYKKYDSIAEFARDFSRIIGMPRYDEARKATTPETYAQGLKKGGYYEDTVENYIAGIKRFEGQYAPTQVTTTAPVTVSAPVAEVRPAPAATPVAAAAPTSGLPFSPPGSAEQEQKNLLSSAFGGRIGSGILTMLDMEVKALGLDAYDVSRPVSRGEMKFAQNLGLGGIFPEEYLKNINIHELFGSPSSKHVTGFANAISKNNIWVNSASDLFSTTAHELTHTLQHNNLLPFNKNPKLVTPGDQYSYSLEGVSSITQLGDEQQASLVAAYTTKKLELVDLEKYYQKLLEDNKKLVEETGKGYGVWYTQGTKDKIDNLNKEIQALQKYIDEIERLRKAQEAAPAVPFGSVKWRFKTWSSEQVKEQAEAQGITPEVKGEGTGIVAAKTEQEKITDITRRETNLRLNIFRAAQVAEIFGLRQNQSMRLALLAAEVLIHQVMQARKAAATAASEAAQTASAAAGASARQGIGLAEHFKGIFRHAAKAATAAFEHVMEWIPIPGVDIALASAAAAGTFAAVMAWGMLGGGGKATGGLIQGAGSGTSDSIPTRLSHGEYVIRADTVSKFGVGFFDALNQGELKQRWTGGIVLASGGLVPTGAMAAQKSAGVTYGKATVTAPTHSSSTSFSFPTTIENLSALDGASVKVLLEEQGDLIGRVALAKVKRYFRNNGVMG